MTNQTYPTSPMLRNLITGIVIINNRQLNTFFSFHDKISRDSQRYLLQEILRNMPELFRISFNSSVCEFQKSWNVRIINWSTAKSQIGMKESVDVWILHVWYLYFGHVHRVSEMIWPQRALSISFVTHSNPVPEIKIKSPLY